MVDREKLMEIMEEFTNKIDEAFIGKNQKTVLTDEEVTLIEDTFIRQDVVDGFSIKVSYEQIREKNYSFSAGQYFEVKIEFVELSQEEFNNRMVTYASKLNQLFAEGKVLEQSINEMVEKLMYEM